MAKLSLPISRWTAGWLLVVAIVAIATAYFGSTRVEGTDAFRSALVGAVVGGAFTLLGGLAGAIYVGAKDDEREKAREQRDLAGAVREIKSELTNLVAATQAFLDFQHAHGDAATLAIVAGVGQQPSFAAPRYGAHSFALSRDLPTAERQAVEDAYERVGFLRQSFAFITTEQSVEESLEAFQDAHDKCSVALASVTSYLQKLPQTP
jgi:hypothetical protein